MRKGKKKRGHGRKEVAGRKVKYRRKEKKWEWTVKARIRRKGKENIKERKE